MIIPTRNRWQWLSESLGSALSQQEVDLEVVVVVDGSTDETGERLSDLARSESRLRVVGQSQARGVAHARNTGLAAAQGTWVSFLDDDDVWAPRKLRTQLDAAAGEDAVFAYSAAVWVDQALAPIAVLPPPDAHDLERTLLASCAIPAGASNVVARTDLVRSLGGFDEALPHFDDWDMWIRLAGAGRAAASEDAVVAYRHHASNRILVEGIDFQREFERLACKHRARLGVGMDRHEAQRWLARGHRRAGRRFRAASLYLRCGLANRSGADLLRVLVSLAVPWPKSAPLAGTIEHVPTWLAHRAGDRPAPG